jgi:hypothetical protein
VTSTSVARSIRPSWIASSFAIYRFLVSRRLVDDGRRTLRQEPNHFDSDAARCVLRVDVGSICPAQAMDAKLPRSCKRRQARPLYATASPPAARRYKSGMRSSRQTEWIARAIRRLAIAINQRSDLATGWIEQPGDNQGLF